MALLHPTPALRPHARHRHLRRWLVESLSEAVVVVMVLVAAWAVAESVAWSTVHDAVQQKVEAAFGLTASDHLDIAVSGPVLPQLLTGTIGEVTVTASDIAVGASSGDLSLRLVGVPVDRGPIVAAHAQLTFTADQATALLPAAAPDLATAAAQLQAGTGCLQQDLPRGLALSGVTVHGALLVAAFDVDRGILVDTALQQVGACG